jgi:hypothetical protein
VSHHPLEIEEEDEVAEAPFELLLGVEELLVLLDQRHEQRELSMATAAWCRGR